MCFSKRQTIGKNINARIRRICLAVKSKNDSYTLYEAHGGFLAATSQKLFIRPFTLILILHQYRTEHYGNYINE